MDFLQAAFLGVVQGIAEFLPISSSGHLAIAHKLLNMQDASANLLFDILLHVATLFAIFLVYYKLVIRLVIEFFKLIADLCRGKFKWKTASPERRMVILLLFSLLPMFLILPFKDAIEQTNANLIVVGCFLLLTGFLLFISDRIVKGKRDAGNMTPRNALVIGFAQAFAVFPGLSRSGSTISAGLLSGLSREFAVQFSFIMAMPTILAAAVFEVKDAVEVGFDFDYTYLVGMAAAFFVALGAMRLVKWLVRTDKFGYFAYYCFAVGLFTIGATVFQMVR